MSLYHPSDCVCTCITLPVTRFLPSFCSDHEAIMIDGDGMLVENRKSAKVSVHGNQLL